MIMDSLEVAEWIEGQRQKQDRNLQYLRWQVAMTLNPHIKESVQPHEILHLPRVDGEKEKDLDIRDMTAEEWAEHMK